MQAPGYVVIRLELVHETRIVPVDGRPPLAPEIVQWLGESRGRFEGDTLVIETRNFNGETPMLIVGPGGKPIPTSRDMRIVERLTRVAQRHDRLRDRRRGPDRADRAVEGRVSAAARRRLSHVRVRLPRGQLGHSQFHRDVALRATPTSRGTAMTKSGDPTRPSGDDRDRTLARLEKALREALERSEAAESMIEDQRQRLKSLGLGREESMRALTEARDELRRVSSGARRAAQEARRASTACRPRRSRCRTTTRALAPATVVRAVARRSHERARRHRGTARRRSRGRPSAPARAERAGHRPLRGNDLAGARVPGRIRDDGRVGRARKRRPPAFSSCSTPSGRSSTRCSRRR